MRFRRFRAIVPVMTEKLKRRLTSVLCADVQGYSRLMEADEPGTLATLQRYRTAMASLIERHDGRIVNTWGDAVIAEFPSVVEAVQCAIEIQQELSAQDPHLPEAQRMRFRIGINLGDVMIDGSDIYGDGVNIAARLQELSEPGGILISGPVYDQVYNKLSVGFGYLGQQQVRNVTAPVMSYRVTLGGATFGQTESKDGVKPAPRTARGTAHAGGAPSPHDNAGSMTSVRGLSGRLADLPRPLRAAIVISVFLFLINLFSGLHEIWFHWPAMSILFVVILWMGLRRNLAPDRAEKRRRSRD
jgi:adenylate cyclase